MLGAHSAQKKQPIPMFPAQPQAPRVTLEVPAQQRTGHIRGGDRNPSRAL